MKTIAYNNMELVQIYVAKPIMYPESSSGSSTGNFCHEVCIAANDSETGRKWTLSAQAFQKLDPFLSQKGAI